MAKAIHGMIRAIDEGRSNDFYRRAAGLDRADDLDFDDFTLVDRRNSGSTFEVALTVDEDRT